MTNNLCRRRKAGRHDTAVTAVRALLDSDKRK